MRGGRGLDEAHQMRPSSFQEFAHKNAPFDDMVLPLELMCGFELREPKCRSKKKMRDQWSSAIQIHRNGKLVKQIRYSIWSSFSRGDAVRKAMEFANGHVIQC